MSFTFGKKYGGCEGVGLEGFEGLLTLEEMSKSGKVWGG